MAVSYERKPMSATQDKRVLDATGQTARRVKQVVEELLPDGSLNERMQMTCSLSLQGLLGALGEAFDTGVAAEVTIDAGLFESMLQGVGTSMGLILGRIGQDVRPVAFTTLMQAIKVGIDDANRIHTPEGHG